MTATRHNQPGMILDADTTTNLRHDLQKLHTGGPLVVDLFAGPGGWDEGLRATGYTGSIIGVEWDESACATASAAGHPRLRAAFAALDPTIFGDVEGIIASPPCQAWSMAGDRKGELDRPEVFSRITAHARNRKPRHVDWHDERSALTAEPMRWITALRPHWVALEQVPPVLPLWEHTATLLREIGYKAWTGVLSAECYGVPQTRRRAILIARRDGLPVGPPAPTHQPYSPDTTPAEVPALFGGLVPPPVSMAEALGFTLTDKGVRNTALRSNYTDGGNTQTRTIRRLTEPATTITGKAVHWVHVPGADTAHGLHVPEGGIDCTRSAPLWSLLNDSNDGNDTVQFARVTTPEVGALQGFPLNYPWRGTTTAQRQQVGDAVPPPLAAAILRPLVASAEGRAAA